MGLASGRGAVRQVGMKGDAGREEPWERNAHFLREKEKATIPHGKVRVRSLDAVSREAGSSVGCAAP